MFEDKVVKETPYGRLVEAGDIGRLLVTKEGEKVLGCFDKEADFYSWIVGLPSKLPEGRLLGKLEHEGKVVGAVPDLMLKLASWVHLTDGNGYGALMELVTLAEIQRYMAGRGNKGKRYEFVPHKLYFGAGEFILTEWAKGRDWNHLNPSQYPKLHDAMEELHRDLRRIDLNLDLTGNNFIYLGRNRKSKKPRFAVIDQLDINLADRLK